MIRTALQFNIVYKTLLCLLVFFLGYEMFVVNAQSATINYQGKLSDNTGAAVVDGDYNVRFWLFQNTGQATTSAIWTEELTGANQVSVVNGLFSVMLGSTTPLSSVDFNQTLYLGVEIGGTGAATWDGEMLPRKPLGTVPAAFQAEEANNAQTLGGIATTSFLRSDTADSMDAFLALTAGGSATDFLVTGTATTTNLVVGSDFISSLTGTGLIISGNALAVSSSSLNITLAGLGDTNLSGPADGDLFSYNGSEWVNVATSSLGFVDTGATDFLSLTDTPGSFNADRILFQSGAAVIDDADFAFAPSTNTLTLGGMTISDILTTHTGASTTTIPSNNPYAWTISTGVGVPPLFRIDTTTGQEFVNIGNGTGDVLIGDIGSGSNLVFEESSTISGQGANTITLGEAGDTFNVAASFFGIGTSSPSQPFTITTNTLLTGALLDRNYTAGTNGMVMQTTGTGVQWVATSTLGFDGGASDFLSLTDTPGSFTANRLLFQTGSAVTDSANLTYDGSLFNAPTFDAASSTIFSQNGIRMFWSTSTTDSIAIGEGSGNAFNDIGFRNVAIGYQSAFDSGSTTASDYLTAVGYQSGYRNTGDILSAYGYLSSFENSGSNVNAYGYLSAYQNQGNDVLAIGRDAARENTANAITAIGWQSGERNSGLRMIGLGVNSGFENTGDYLVSVGDQSGFQNTGTGVTAVGYQSAYQNSGLHLVAFGQEAGDSNSGNYSTMIGYRSGLQNSGEFLVSLGYQSAYQNTADNVTAIGREALRYRNATNTVALGNQAGRGLNTTRNSTGVENSLFLGYRSGYLIDSGSNNILIGYQAADSLSTGSNNLIIGYDVEAPSNTGSNQLNIGNLIFGTGVDGTGTTLSSGNIGIGTTSPNAKLTVAGNINIDNSLTNAVVSYLGVPLITASTTNNSYTLGEYAGYYFSPDTTRNVALGYFAGYNASTSAADNNNYIGYVAGGNNEGDLNNLFGYFAGAQNTGSNNNILGPWAGSENTGSTNNLFGRFAGNRNSGDFNNLIGRNTGENNTGDFNEFIGNYTARYLSSDNTIAIGGYALFGGSSYNASNTIAIGYRAGYGARTGSSNNILLGYQAADSLTTGANNLIIGYDVEAPSNTGDNQLNIGNLIFGTGVDGTGTTLSSGNIGIGTTSPSSKLSVWGDFRVGTGSVPTLFADTSANWVGIGTTSRSITSTTTERLTIAGGGIIANSPTDPQIVGGVDTAGFADEITIAGRYAYVADFSNGLEIIDISDPTNPTIVGGVDTAGFAYKVTIAGRYAYVADGTNGLEIIDISDPTSPSIIGGVDTDGQARGVTIAGRYAYVADQSNGLEIIDISDPTNPAIVGGVDTAAFAVDVTINGRYAYLADESNGLVVIDISDPTNPAIVGGVDTAGFALKVTIAGHYAYVADGTNGLEIIDISDPTNPTIVGGVGTADARGVTIAGRYAYVADNSNGLEIIDISDSTSPSIIGGVDTDGQARGVTIAGRFAYVADSGNGLEIIDIGGSEFSSLFAGALGATQANIDQDLIVGQNTLINSNLNVGNDTRIGGLLSIQGYSSSTDTVNQALLSLGGASTRNSFMSFLGGVSSTTQNVWSAGLNQADGSFRIASSSGLTTNPYFTIGAGGNVGIGTSSPYAKLSVDGDLALTGGIYDNSASLGTAGMIMQTTGAGVQWVATSSLGIPVSPFSTTAGNAYDINTASFDSTGLSVTVQEFSPFSMLFNNDGTILYVMGTGGDDIDAYPLPTPYDISSYTSGTSIVLDVSVQETSPQSMIFNNDGTILYVMGNNDDDINAYPLPTPYDISSYTSGTSVALSVSGQESSPRDILFNNDGTILYVMGTTGDDINAYPLPTPYDISSYTSGTSVALDVSGESGAPNDMLFNNDGTVLYVVDAGADINAYPLPTPYDISSYTSGTSVALDVSGDVAAPVSALFNGDGTALLVLDTTNRDISVYAISEPANTEVYVSDVTANFAIGTTTPQSKLSLENLVLDGAGISGLSQYLTTTNSVDAALQFGNYFNLNASNTATTTLVGSSYLLSDNTTFGNTVRGLEVQADRGSNTQGENTALSGFARTFGVRGFTSGDAGGSFEPAGGFFETGGSDQGNAIRGFSSSITSASLLSLFQDTSNFTGTGLQMNFGNTTGSFSSSTSKYLDFQNAGTSVFTVSAFGTTTIGDGTTNNMAGLQIGYGGICVDNDGTCTASTTGRITSVESQTGNSDLAEMYFSSDDLESGQIVSLVGELSIERAIPGTDAPILGVVSTKPGLTLGFDDVSTRAGESGFPIALSGRVPVQLSTENGEVLAGDELMLSSLPGIAMKSDGTGTVVGIALEDFDEDRLYSDTFINQFGDDVAEPVFEPITTNSDPRINDGCYFGGGGTADAEPCVPLSTDTEFEQLLEANQLAEADSVLEAIEDLKYEDSETITLNNGDRVRVGQIVMFVDRAQPELNQGQRDLLASLLSTTTLAVQVDEDEPETLMERLIALADGFVDGVFKAIGIEVDFVKTDEVQSETLCLGSTCIDEAELRSLLEQRATTTTTVSEETEDVEGGTESTEETDNSGGTTQPPVTTTGTTTSSTTDQTAEPVIDTATSSPDTVAEPIADTETEVSTETTPEQTTVEEVVEADIPEEEISSEPEIIADPEPVPELVEEEIVPEVPEV